MNDLIERFNWLREMVGSYDLDLNRSEVERVFDEIETALSAPLPDEVKNLIDRIPGSLLRDEIVSTLARLSRAASYHANLIEELARENAQLSKVIKNADFDHVVAMQKRIAELNEEADALRKQADEYLKDKKLLDAALAEISGLMFRSDHLFELEDACKIAKKARAGE